MGNIGFERPFGHIDHPGMGIADEMDWTPGGDAHRLICRCQPEILHAHLIRRIVFALDGHVQAGLQALDQPIYPNIGDNDAGGTLEVTDRPFPGIVHKEAWDALHGAALLDQLGRDGPAEIRGRRTLEPALLDLLVSQASFRLQVTAMRRRQSQLRQKSGIGLVYDLGRCPISLGRLLLSHGLLSLHLIRWSKAACQKFFTDLPIRLGVADLTRLRVERQHPAVSAAAVAVPHILHEVEAHLSAPVTAEWAVRIGIARTPPPDMQAEEFCHIHDGKWKP